MSSLQLCELGDQMLVDESAKNLDVCEMVLPLTDCSKPQLLEAGGRNECPFGGLLRACCRPSVTSPHIHVMKASSPPVRPQNQRQMMAVVKKWILSLRCVVSNFLKTPRLLHIKPK